MYLPLSLSLFLSITRLFYMIAVFFVFRMRFYAAWCGAEAGCISAGLGCYPEKALSKPGGGPTVNYRYIITGLTSTLKEDASIIVHLHLGRYGFLFSCCWKFVFMPICFPLLWPVLIPPPKRNMTSEPSRTSTATTLTSVWRSDTACVTGTWRFSGGCITTSTPIPPSKPTLSGKALCVQQFLLILRSNLKFQLWDNSEHLHIFCRETSEAPFLT